MARPRAGCAVSCGPSHLLLTAPAPASRGTPPPADRPTNPVQQLHRAISALQLMHRRIGRYRLLARRSRPGSLQACSDSSPVSERPRTTYLSEHCTPISSADTRRAVAFINNGLMYLFSNFRYYLERRQIEYVQNVGITTTIHNYLTKSRNYAGGSWFWLPDRGTTAADAHNEPWRTSNLFVNPQAAERPVDRRYRSIAPSTSTPPLSFFTGRMPFLPPNQQRQSTDTHTHTHTRLTALCPGLPG